MEMFEYNLLQTDFEKQGWVFHGFPLNPMSLTCGLTAVKATQHESQERVK